MRPHSLVILSQAQALEEGADSSLVVSNICLEGLSRERSSQSPDGCFTEEWTKVFTSLATINNKWSIFTRNAMWHIEIQKGLFEDVRKHHEEEAEARQRSLKVHSAQQLQKEKEALEKSERNRLLRAR